MPRIRHDDLLLRVLKDLNDVRSALRRVSSHLPLFDIDNENTPTQLTESQDDYAPGNYDVLRLSSSTPVSITGIRKGIKGRKLRIMNVGDYPITFVSQSLNSTAANRFKFRGGASVIDSGDVINFYYDFTQQRWIEGTQVFDYDFFRTLEESTLSGTWTGIAWSPALSLFVVVGSTGIRTSPDGETWTSRTSAISNPYDVAWSPSLSLFVSVSNRTDVGSAGNKVQTSPDGITWTARTSADGLDSDTWRSVCWADDLGLFVAVGLVNGGSIMTSPDGTNWTQRSDPVAGQTYVQVVWCDTLALLVAVNNATAATTHVMTSSDGITWNSGLNATLGCYGQMPFAWNNTLGIGCLFARSSTATRVDNKFYTTTNGTTWTLQRTMQVGTYGPYIDNVVTSDELRNFLGFGPYGHGKSSNGINWTTDSFVYTNPNDMIYVEEFGQLVGVASNKVLRTPE